MNDTRDRTSGSEGAGAEDVFVELLGQIINRLDRQEEKLDQLLETVAELHEEQERQADALEENTARIDRLADAQFETADATRQLVEVASVDRLHAGVTVMLLQKLFPDRATDVAIVDAANKRLISLRDTRHFDLLVHLKAILEERRREQKEQQEREEAERRQRKDEENGQIEMYREQLAREFTEARERGHLYRGRGDRDDPNGDRER